jgi:2-succinyl-5-enolpyruvyl-6-hydroxy-3-cyclohexene-1-carboxylate synthase
VVRLAETLGYPVLADPLSQVRCGPHHRPLIIDSYEVFLREADIVEQFAPDVILRFGPVPVSRAALLFLQRHAGVRQIVVDEPEKWPDFTFTATDVIHCHPRLLCDGLIAALDGRESAEPDWAARWHAVAAATRSALEAGLHAAESISEPGAVAALAAVLPAGATLFAGNSMPIRDVDIFFPGGERPVQMLGNRGASGIDGIVSTALGASTAASPLVLLIGDISFYHDLNGLLAAGRHGLSATIVLLNNDGGGIFSFLPQAGYPEHFEELFGTPHGLDFRHAAALYGLAYARAERAEDVRQALAASLAAPGVSLIEVRTERGANLRLHRQVIADALVAARQTSVPKVP